MLVAETETTPEKLNGVKIWQAYIAKKGLNDETRQDDEAEALLRELSISMPDNCTATQFGKLIAKFTLKVDTFMLRPLTPEMKVKWILDRLPKTGACAALEGRRAAPVLSGCPPPAATCAVAHARSPLSAAAWPLADESTIVATRRRPHAALPAR